MGRSKKLHKSLQLYFSKKLKRVPNIRIQFPGSGKPVNPHSTSWLLSACKYPKTPSFAVSRDNGGGDGDGDGDGDGAGAAAAHGATLSDVDRFLHENFHSLYIRDADPEADAASDVTNGSPPRFDPEPGPVRSSDRFFVSPTTTSNSILLDRAGPDTSASSSDTSASGSTSVVVGGGDDVAAAVVTFSKDPYEDFRRSMREMVDARHVDASQPLDWDFMEELLFCYLELNDKSVHRYILTAFTDLTVSFRRPRDPAAAAVDAATERRRRRTRRKAAAAVRL